MNKKDLLDEWAKSRGYKDFKAVKSWCNNHQIEADSVLESFAIYAIEQHKREIKELFDLALAEYKSRVHPRTHGRKGKIVYGQVVVENRLLGDYVGETVELIIFDQEELNKFKRDIA